MCYELYFIFIIIIIIIIIAILFQHHAESKPSVRTSERNQFQKATKNYQCLGNQILRLETIQTEQ